MPIINFDHVPDLSEMLDGGGIPGFEYALVANDHLEDILGEDDGWSHIRRAPIYHVNGKTAYLVGRGSRIPGAKQGSTIPMYWVDEGLLDAPAPEVEDDSE